MSFPQKTDSCGTLNGKNRCVKSAKEADRGYFDGNYWKTQDWLISSRDPSQSFSRDVKNTHKMPSQLASQGGARTKGEKSQHVTQMTYKAEASRKSKPSENALTSQTDILSCLVFDTLFI